MGGSGYERLHAKGCWVKYIEINGASGKKKIPCLILKRTMSFLLNEEAQVLIFLKEMSMKRRTMIEGQARL